MHHKTNKNTFKKMLHKVHQTKMHHKTNKNTQNKTNK